MVPQHHYVRNLLPDLRNLDDHASKEQSLEGWLRSVCTGLASSAAISGSRITDDDRGVTTDERFTYTKVALTDERISPGTAPVGADVGFFDRYTCASRDRENH